MNFYTLRLSILSVCMGLMVNVAQAIPLTGAVEYVGVFTPSQTNNFNVSNLTSVKISSIEGDLGNWLLTGQTVDLSGIVLTVYPSFWTVNGVGTELLSGDIDDQGDQSSIDLAGLGVINYDGYDQTSIKWTFSETLLTPNKSLFTFRLETINDPVAVQEPATLGLLALGLVACGVLRSRVNKN